MMMMMKNVKVMSSRHNFIMISYRARNFASSNAPASMTVFDRETKRKQRDRANRDRGGESDDFDYLRDYVATQLTDRLMDITKEFPVAVNLGCDGMHVAKHLDTLGGVERLINVDTSEMALRRGLRGNNGVDGREDFAMLGDEEFLGLQDESVDLVLSSMSLHWVNDLPGTFAQIYRALKPDGVFLAAMLGGETLNELRSSFVAAEQERSGGVSPRVSPLIQISDAGTLLQSAGFSLPCVDTETVHVGYADAVSVWEHLQRTGDTNASLGRLTSKPSVDTLLAAASVYQSAFYVDDSGDGDGVGDDGVGDVEEKKEKGEEGYLPATFQIVYLIGWKIDKTQAGPISKPLLRGSASLHLSELSGDGGDDNDDDRK